MAVSTRNQLIIFSILALLLVLTRSQHFASLHHLPSASWAAFFLAGVYLPAWGLTALFALVFAVDFPAFLTGTNEVCFTQAYAMLLPAYAVLWLGGRWYAKHHHFSFKGLLWLISIVVLTTFGCELISSGSYYVLSGQFLPTIGEFTDRVMQYYPYSLVNAGFYITLAGFVHSVFLAIQHIHAQRLKHG